MIRPGPEEAAQLAQGGKRIAVCAEILADLETPTSAYWKLAHDRRHSFLLESVTGGERLGRYSFIGFEPYAVIRTKGGEGEIVRHGKSEKIECSKSYNPLQHLRDLLCNREYASIEGLPPFTGGAVGIVAYDCVRFFERVPDDTLDDLECDDMKMLLCDTLVAFDHAKNRILVIAHADDDPGSYLQAAHKINEIIARLREPMPALPVSQNQKPRFAANMSREAYEEAVRKIIEYIKAGDGVQMVMSQRFSASVTAHPISMYRALRYVNPSPYMYLMRLGEYDVIGASPEILVTVVGESARVRPIAGTRKRGETEKEDACLERELLADEKERAEHIMLVDLGRNDIGRIAQPGSVEVNELMAVERYSHVMHIVSDVTGKLKPGLDSFDVLQACFPAGTVSGAPKVRAMEIIEELEPTRRGPYAGAAGYFAFNGDMDMAISIRTIFLKDGNAHVQAGAGIVFDSVPENEWQECANKAAAVLRAIEMAETGELE